MAETRSGGTPASGVLASADSSPTVIPGPDGLRVRPDVDGVRVDGRAPFQRPHPSASQLVFVGVWVVGLIVALFVPAFIVGPTEREPVSSAVWAAFGLTALGCLIMMAAAALLWRHSRNVAVLVFGGVPAVACLIGGIILVATKLTLPACP